MSPYASIVQPCRNSKDCYEVFTWTEIAHIVNSCINSSFMLAMKISWVSSCSSAFPVFDIAKYMKDRIVLNEKKMARLTSFQTHQSLQVIVCNLFGIPFRFVSMRNAKYSKHNTVLWILIALILLGHWLRIICRTNSALYGSRIPM